MKQLLLRCSLVALAAGSPLSANGAQSTEEAKHWLERMMHATQNLNYEGTFVYIQGPHVETMRLVHGGGQGNERQRLVSLTGPLREILVKSDGVIRLLPSQQASFAGSEYRYSRFPISIPRELGQLENQYDFELAGQDRAAGVDVQVVAIKPRDTFRYGYRLWLDQRNGMLLRSALLDDKDYPIEQLMFTDFQLKPEISEDAFKSLISAEGTASEPAAQTFESSKPLAGTPVAHSAWKVGQLPAGFVKILHNRFMEASGQHPTEHMVFADGLATVSVFLERLNGAAPILQGGSQLGSMNAFGAKMDDYQILVVGEVPAATVQGIATSMLYDPADSKSVVEEHKP